MRKNRRRNRAVGRESKEKWIENFGLWTDAGLKDGPWTLDSGHWTDIDAENIVVIRSRGPQWDDTKPLEGQLGWREHADFMDALFMEGFVAFAGPLEGTRDALVIIRADSPQEIANRLVADPWIEHGLLVLKDCWPWQIRLGSLDE